MVVQHNLTAMNSNRMLGITTSAQAKTTEKLSSGYKINRAADDASGLAISEKMRKQIRGLTQASANAQDGISAVQTAEGALTEVEDMLQRINELAVKSANGTQSLSDRDAIQAEVDQLVTEIDRVAETTKFNETYLLKGDSAAKKGYTFGYAEATKTEANATMYVDGPTKLTATIEFNSITVDADAQNAIANSLKNQGLTISLSNIKDLNNTAAVAELSYGVSLNGAVSDKYKVVTQDTAGGIFEIQDNDGNLIATVTASRDASAPALADNESISANVSATSVSAAESGTKELFDADGNKISTNALDKYFGVNSTGGPMALSGVEAYDAVGTRVTLADMADYMATPTQDITGRLQVALHVGADATSNNQITMNIESMSAKSLGIVGLRVDGKSDANALSAIETIKAAITKVSAQRGDLGAMQNRLEHTINNLDNVVENTTSAESAIRDTDMATTMVQYSNNNILSQAGTSMLAQANQSNQSVLSLLQ